tara:strand:+ start:564 stop:767 length:204 start_codon:yes stop_codon:yes gene_type:complete
MLMIDFSELITSIVSEIKQNYEEYFDDEEKFIKASIEELIDLEDSSAINDIFISIIDDVDYLVKTEN